MTHQPHILRTVAQEYVCTRCNRRWDFDEAPDEDEPCDAPPKKAVVKKKPKTRQK